MNILLKASLISAFLFIGLYNQPVKANPYGFSNGSILFINAEIKLDPLRLVVTATANPFYSNGYNPNPSGPPMHNLDHYVSIRLMDTQGLIYTQRTVKSQEIVEFILPDSHSGHYRVAASSQGGEELIYENTIQVEFTDID